MLGIEFALPIDRRSYMGRKRDKVANLKRDTHTSWHDEGNASKICMPLMNNTLAHPRRGTPPKSILN